MKQIKRTVDDRLPKWLHSKFLSAVDYIWQVKGDNDESIRRVEAVANSGVFTDEEMSWVMLLLIMPKVNEMIKKSDEWRNFQAMKKASVH
tara:strand:- start:286 stop:555 length:270 start_codon:yes stop_codon:yes gene_type:complete